MNTDTEYYSNKGGKGGGALAFLAGISRLQRLDFMTILLKYNGIFRFGVLFRIIY